MRKQMKMLSWLWVIFLSAMLCVSCRTITEYITVKPEYADPPARTDPGIPETVQDLADTILYYEEILSEWESWGISVYEALEIPLPDSLQYIKDITEQ